MVVVVVVVWWLSAGHAEAASVRAPPLASRHVLHLSSRTTPSSPLDVPPKRLSGRFPAPGIPGVAGGCMPDRVPGLCGSLAGDAGWVSRRPGSIDDGSWMVWSPTASHPAVPAKPTSLPILSAHKPHCTDCSPSLRYLSLSYQALASFPPAVRPIQVGSPFPRSPLNFKRQHPVPLFQNISSD
ncbi:hypothetical protein MAPG_02315 [Magnaporthiopsis poae ATCC 64411]|uniref:Secreted protein n=1 Tax=Magnaporthiopsis poae (strain ATCC 64411 / 73-15) TaxID=644358 RepID=A0A0C4DR16_MAGP6|nr:hypothetical protein MAPG_02315 [Magnaporthiopsis poae ATCC 64411]